MEDDGNITRLMEMTSSGYSVRKSEETINFLQKENFNLKLKIFFLESKFGISSSDEINLDCDKEYVDLLIENENLRKELSDKQEIMKNALHAIEMLEEEKNVQQIKSAAIIKDQNKKIEDLKVKN